MREYTPTPLLYLSNEIIHPTPLLYLSNERIHSTSPFYISVMRGLRLPSQPVQQKRRMIVTFHLHKSPPSPPPLYCTVLYCIVLYCTVLHLHHTRLPQPSAPKSHFLCPDLKSRVFSRNIIPQFLPHFSPVQIVQYNTVQYSTVQYSTVQYSTVQYSTVQYSTDRQLCLTDTRLIVSLRL